MKYSERIATFLFDAKEFLWITAQILRHQNLDSKDYIIATDSTFYLFSHSGTKSLTIHGLDTAWNGNLTQVIQGHPRSSV